MSFIRFIVQALAVGILTVYYSIIVIVKMLGKSDTSMYFKYSRAWSRRLLSVCGVTVKVSGAELLPKGESRVYVVNHASLFDIPVRLASLDDNIRIMYKKELEKIPIFGWNIKLSPFIAVQRESVSNAMESINTAIEAISHGESVIIFAEGTRSKDGNLQAFKRGAFYLAARSNKPIVPIILKGTHSILPKETLKFNEGEVQLVIKEPLRIASELSRAQEKELMQTVWNTMNEELESGK
ncbi:MAG: 1-acyl-sn-glycerol-3-phosphate acyltransferase [Ignavibacteria bacterium]|nr:1-acyl-sn-glycerol-3-phosphate acyltransferase [Ignavibacteria bacterium]